MSELGQRIRSLRKDRRWTQGELASRCNSTISAISQIERGEIRSPRADLLYAIAHALDVDGEYLRTGKGAAPPSSRPLSSRAREIAEIYDGLTSSQQDELLERIRAIRKQNEEIFQAMSSSKPRKE